MDGIVKESVIEDYLQVPNIRRVLSEAKELGKILKPNERTISLEHCLKNNYIISSNGRYSITTRGKEALSIIQDYIDSYLTK